jgi:hypothetical protein
LTIYFDDNFDATRDLSKWTGQRLGGTGVAGVVQSTVKYEGTWAGAFAKTVGAGFNYSTTYKNITSPPMTLYIRCYFRFSVLPAVGQALETYPEFTDVANTYSHCIRINNVAGVNNWQLVYYDNVGVQYSGGSITPAPTIDTWYYVELQVTANAGAGIVRCWIDDAADASSVLEAVPTLEVTALTNDARPPESGGVGIYNFNSMTAACTLYHDLVKISDSFIGPERFSPLATLARIA